MAPNRFTMMKTTQTLYLLFISGFCFFLVGSSDFHLVTLLKTYQEAKSHCREMYSDLATVHNAKDMNELRTLVSTSNVKAWIGLETGDVWIWHWSWPDQKLDFFKWKAGEPTMNNNNACAAMDPHGDWFESNCGTKRSFVCHGNSDTSRYIFVTDTKSWRDAQNHCRGLSSYLVSIRSTEENEAVRNMSVSQDVWIGLFKDPWKWSDRSNSSFRNWRSKQPNYLNGQDCVAAIFKAKGQWNDLNCRRKFNFVCHGAKKSITPTTEQTPGTRVTDEMPITLPNSSSPWITTFQLSVNAFSHQSNSSNFSHEATTASELTSTTDPVSYVSTTGLNDATTETTTMTAAHPTPTTPVQVTALTTMTSSQDTTKTTLMPSNRNLILIQENMTWIEALSYCREHHVDLVYITTGDIHKKVAEKARDATSAHVWLGLRYTCNSDFWFWTSSITGCYQNWAPGHGSEVKYDCGFTGAIEATRGQQWVGLPETEKLNFICHACE